MEYCRHIVIGNVGKEEVAEKQPCFMFQVVIKIVFINGNWLYHWGILQPDYFSILSMNFLSAATIILKLSFSGLVCSPRYLGSQCLGWSPD